MLMSTFRFPLTALSAMSTWLVSAAFRRGRRGIGLLLLWAMAACQSGEAPATDAARAALDRDDSAAADTSDAAQGTVTFSIDGRPESGVSCTLINGVAKTNFMVNFVSDSLDLSLMGTDESPFIIGKFAILDGIPSPVSATATLPPRFRKESPEGGQYLSCVGLIQDRTSPIVYVYDWGAGIQRLTGREVGRVVFTRIGNGTVDGSFQSAVYLEPFDPKVIKYQGEDRFLQQTKEHLLKGTFKDVPVIDAQKALNGGG